MNQDTIIELIGLKYSALSFYLRRRTYTKQKLSKGPTRTSELAYWNNRITPIRRAIKKLLKEASKQ
jgi:hypothetical protein